MQSRRTTVLALQDLMRTDGALVHQERKFAFCRHFNTLGNIEEFPVQLCYNNLLSSDTEKATFPITNSETNAKSKKV
jgi:hypothetical protein